MTDYEVVKTSTDTVSVYKLRLTVDGKFKQNNYIIRLITIAISIMGMYVVS